MGPGTGDDRLMCGMVGYFRASPGRVSAAHLDALLAPIRSRGSGDEGVCLVSIEEGAVVPLSTARSDPQEREAARIESEAGRRVHDVALVHTRFPVMERGITGHQPFVSGDGSVVGAFNGSIYNHVELREELKARGVAFRTQSDTEVLVEGYREWGQDLWARLNGFWAAALCDVHRKELTLCRDRFGIAPLYVREADRRVWFSNVIAPLLDVAPQGTRIHEPTLRGFLETGLKDFGSDTCFRPVRAVPAGTYLTWRVPGPGSARHREARFWSFPDGRLSEGELSLDEAADGVRSILLDAVALRLRAQVPVAFELSGGVDSSCVVAAAAAQGTRPTAYTLAYTGANEEPIARIVARHHRLDYRVLPSEEDEFPKHALEFAARMEEPYHAPNVYTHFRMRQRMKAEGVDVAICGSGGDEVFAGYDTEFWPAAREDLKHSGYRRLALVGEAFFRFQSWDRAKDALWEAAKWPKRVVGRGLIRAGAVPPARTESPEAHPEIGLPAVRLRLSYPTRSFHEQRLFHFQIGLLPHYLATDDRFTMSLPLEQRNPFLDHRLVELGLQLPPSFLFRNGWTKYVLRKAMDSYLPRSVLWRRRKMGFPLQLRRFLRTHRDFLAPFPEEVEAAGLLPGESRPYDTLLRSDPARLWRACSTGLWLRSSAAPGLG